MSLTALALLVTAALYAGFQWTVRVVVYPQFARVLPEAFPAYEAAHQRLVSIAVGPLFAALGVAALAAFVHPPDGVPRAVAALAPVLDGALLAVTGALAVPLHRRLSAGFDAATHGRLLAVDTVRLVLAVALVGLGLGLLLA